jgi:hypothetical protein
LFIDTVNNKEFQTLTGARSEAFETGPMTFHLDKLDLAKYTIINLVQFYPPEAPVFGYLDRRVLSPSVTLRRKSGSEIVEQDRIKQIELASLYYINEHQKTNLEDLYIIYCDNEDAYLWLRGDLISLKTLKPCEKIASGNPILIFNEKYVWYPLMQRDDTKQSKSLNNLVEKYKTDIQKPLLSETEEKLLQKLLLVTELTGPEYDMAILSAAKVSSFYGFYYRVKNKEISRKWHELFPDLTEGQIQSTIPPHPLGGFDDVILEQISGRANYLSPISAYLAALGKDKDKNSIALMGKKYRELGFEWNCLWTLGFEESTIDDSFFSHGGTCEVHANNFSSILNLLGVDNIIIHGYKIGESTHQIVYIPECDWVFTNVRLMASQGTILHCPKTIFMISDKDNWAIIVKDSYIGTMPPSQAVEKLEFLKAKHGDYIKGVNTDKQVSEISFEELIKYLKKKDKSWEPIKLP